VAVVILITVLLTKITDNPHIDVMKAGLLRVIRVRIRIFSIIK